jgi:hypothetical protein
MSLVLWPERLVAGMVGQPGRSGLVIMNMLALALKLARRRPGPPPAGFQPAGSTDGRWHRRHRGPPVRTSEA